MILFCFYSLNAYLSIIAYQRSYQMLSLSNLLLTTFFIVGVAGFLYAQETGPERWSAEMEAFAEADKKDPVAPGGILFVGSSSIALWKDMAAYFPDERVINRGFGGSVFKDLIYHANSVIYPYQPELIFVYEGDNDIVAGDKPGRIKRNAKKLRRMIARRFGKALPVVFISPKPSVARWDYKAAYEETNAKLARFAARTPNTWFADVWTPALDQRGNVFHHIFLEDNLHMNAAGYDIWKAVLTPFLAYKQP